MSIKELVEDTIKKNEVIIFSKSWCPYCKRVKGLFASEFPDVTPTILELDERDDGDTIQAYLLEKTGQRTVPMSSSSNSTSRKRRHCRFIEKRSLAKLVKA